jgi:hypothetical protein
MIGVQGNVPTIGPVVGLTVASHDSANGSRDIQTDRVANRLKLVTKLHSCARCDQQLASALGNLDVTAPVEKK